MISIINKNWSLKLINAIKIKTKIQYLNWNQKIKRFLAIVQSAFPTNQNSKNNNKQINILYKKATKLSVFVI